MELVLNYKEEEMSRIIEAEYLYNNSGTHDKVYNVIIREDHNWAAVGRGGYIVEAEWGPRLGVRKAQVKYSGSNRSEARNEFTKLVQSKKSKGYRSVNGSTTDIVTNRPIPQDIPKHKLTKEVKPKVEEFNHNPIQERRLDPDL